MPLTEILPLLKKLSHSEQLLLLNFVVAELLNESGLIPLDVQNKVASQGLYDTFEAAAG
jgi:hypothetical protein